jgi:hypothetical protein
VTSALRPLAAQVLHLDMLLGDPQLTTTECFAFPPYIIHALLAPGSVPLHDVLPRRLSLHWYYYLALALMLPPGTASLASLHMFMDASAGISGCGAAWALAAVGEHACGRLSLVGHIAGPVDTDSLAPGWASAPSL